MYILYLVIVINPQEFTWLKSKCFRSILLRIFFYHHNGRSVTVLWNLSSPKSLCLCFMMQNFSASIAHLSVGVNRNCLAKKILALHTKPREAHTHRRLCGLQIRLMCCVEKKILPLLLTFTQQIKARVVPSSTSHPQATWYLSIGTL